MTPTRALIEAAELLLAEHNCDDGSVDYKGTETECHTCIQVRAAISSAKAAEEGETELINRLINAKRLLDTKGIDDGDFQGFAEEIAEEFIEVREKEGL